MSTENKKEEKLHKEKMQKQKKKVDASIAAAKIERGIALLMTGPGKGKTSSAFGMVFRALGYGQTVGVVQFIKGAQESGEVNFFKAHCVREKERECSEKAHNSSEKGHKKSASEIYQMGTGFTWNTQDKAADIAASERTWEVADRMLKDESFDLVILDELTYMLGYKYLDKEMVINAIKNRPYEQSVVVTGRGGGGALREAMDTVSEIKDVKHAYRAGIKARKGVDC